MKPELSGTKRHKDSKISAEEFVFVLVENLIQNGRPRTKSQLAKDLGIARRTFYRCFHKYAAEIEAAKSTLQKQIYFDLYMMLRKRLRGKWDLGLAMFALGMSGNTFPHAGGMNVPGGTGLNQNFYGMDLGTLEQLMAKHFQEARRKNSSKPGRKAWAFGADERRSRGGPRCSEGIKLIKKWAYFF